MKKIILPFVTFVTLFLALSVLGQTASEQIVKRKFTEYMTPRLDGRHLKLKFFSGDVNSDGIPDIVLSYCVEATDNDRDAGGGNAMMNLACMQEGIAVYLKVGSDYVLKAEKGMDNFKVYTKNEISFEIKSIERGKIVCESTAFGPDDPMCCPSVKKNVYVKYDNGKLVKL